MPQPRKRLRYAERASGDDTCSVESCRIRGRYVFQGRRMCYGHVSKAAVDHLLDSGDIQDNPQAEYVNQKRPFKHRGFYPEDPSPEAGTDD